QIGLMFIALYPVPFVDASAAAMLPAKSERILVGAAGMMVELVLAAGAMYLWLLLEPSLVRAVAFDVIVIAGLSTIIVNGNPLLRFDGYFILSDLIEIPNLARRCSRFWGDWMIRRVFRLRTVDPIPVLPGEKLWFILYGPAAYVYRMIVVISLSV